MSPVRTPLRTLRQTAAALCSTALVITAMGSVTPAQAAVSATVTVTTQSAMAPSGTIPVTVDVVCPTADYGVGPINVDISMGTAAAFGQLSIPGFEANSTAARTTNPYHWVSTYTLNAPSVATLAGATTMNITTVVTGRPCVNDATGITDIKTLTVASAPAAPKITATTVGNRQATVTYSTVADPAKAPVLGYEYRVNGGAAVSTGTANPFTITGLTNERASTIAVRAVNATGAGAWSSNASVTPVGAPAAPTRLQTLGYDKDIAIKFTAPSKTVNAIDKYEYSTDAGATWLTTGSTAVITDIKALSTDGITPLTNGAIYPVQVRAHNSLGYSPASTTVNGFPVGAPGAPANVSVTPTSGSVVIAFDPFGSPLTASQTIQSFGATATASNDGGSSITGYQYSTDNGVTFVSAGTTLPLTITNTSDSNTPLVDGTEYLVFVRAVNALGTGAVSRPIIIIPGGVPSQPVVLATTPSNGAVTFSAQVDNVGTAISSVECQMNGGPATAANIVGTSSTFTAWTVSGLVNGVNHSFSCRVANAAGWSAWSAATITAASDIPAAPALNRVVPGNGLLTVEFTPGATNGSDVTSYSVYQNGLLYSDVNGTTTFTSSPITMTGLANGDVQTITVTATNAAGESLQSNAVNGTVGQTLVDVAGPTQTVPYGTLVTSVAPVTTPATSPTDWTVAPTCLVYATTDTAFATPLTGRQHHGTYATHCTGGVANSYYPYTYTDGVFTIDPAVVTITASSASVTYGTTTPDVSYVVTPPESNTMISQAPTCSIFAPADTTYSTPLSGVLNAGTYVTRCSGATLDTDYVPKYDKGTFTVTKADTTSTITCPSTSVTYTGGEQTPCSVTITSQDGLNITSAPSYANNVRAGTATATYTYAGDSNHKVSTATPVSFTIAPAASNVTVTCPASVVYNG
ncbi:MAG: fibronectin type III domain-containing protein, partial [Actinomycetes bacterium]